MSVSDARETAYQSLSRYRSQLMGAATLWVMLFHAYPFRFGIRLLDEFKALGNTGVDIFVMLSAMGIYVSLSKTELRGRDFSRFYIRRLTRILPAFWLVVGAYSLFLVQAGRIGWSTLLWNLSTLYYWFQIPDAFNWYIPAILGFYLLAPFYVKLFRRCPEKWKGAMTALSAPVSYGIYLCVGIPLGITYFVCRLPAFAIGGLVGHYLLSGQSLNRRHAIVWTGISLAGLVLTVLTRTGRIYVSICYRFAAQLIPVCLLLAWLMGKLPQWLRSFLGLLGVCSLEIYLLNVVVTREFDLLAPFLDRGPRHLFYYAVVYTANLLLGVGLHRLLSRLLPGGRSPGGPR